MTHRSPRTRWQCPAAQARRKSLSVLVKVAHTIGTRSAEWIGRAPSRGRRGRQVETSREQVRARRTGRSRSPRLFPWPSLSRAARMLVEQPDLTALQPAGDFGRTPGPRLTVGLRERPISPAPLEDQLRVLGRWFASVRWGVDTECAPYLVRSSFRRSSSAGREPGPVPERCPRVGPPGVVAICRLVRQDRADESVDGRSGSPCRRAPGLAR